VLARSVRQRQCQIVLRARGDKVQRNLRYADGRLGVVVWVATHRTGSGSLPNLALLNQRRRTYWRASEIRVNTSPIPNALAAVRVLNPNSGRISMLAVQLIEKPIAMLAQASTKLP